MSDYPGRRRGSGSQGSFGGGRTFGGTAGPASQATQAANLLLDLVETSPGNFNIPEAPTFSPPVLAPQNQPANAPFGKRGWKPGRITGLNPFALAMQLAKEAATLPWTLQDEALAQGFIAPDGWEKWIDCPWPPTDYFNAALLCQPTADIMDEIYQRVNPYWSAPRWYSSWHYFTGEFDQFGRKEYFSSESWRSPVQENQDPAPDTFPEYKKYPWPTPRPRPGPTGDPELLPGEIGEPQPRAPGMQQQRARERRAARMHGAGYNWPHHSEWGYGWQWQRFKDWNKWPPPEPPQPPTQPPPNRPPGPGKRELKVKPPPLGPIWRALRRVAERAMETCELADVLFKALPVEVQRDQPRGTNGKVSCANQFAAIYKNIKSLDACKVVEGLINNEFEDRAYGMFGQMAQETAIHGLYTEQRAWSQMRYALDQYRKQIGDKREPPPFVPRIDLDCANGGKNINLKFMAHDVTLDTSS